MYISAYKISLALLAVLTAGTLMAQAPLAAQTGVSPEAAGNINSASGVAPSSPAGQTTGAAEKSSQPTPPQPLSPRTFVPQQSSLPPAQGKSASASENPEALHVVVGRALFLNTPQRLRRVYVSNPTVIETVTSSPRDVIVTAREAGTSTLVLWTEDGATTEYTVLADLGLSGLEQSLQQAFPGRTMRVEAQGNKILLSGSVASTVEAEQAAKLAALYSKDVVSSLLIQPTHPFQVQLKVRFAEMDRSKLDQFGINLFSVNQNAASSTTGQYSAPSFPQLGGSGNSALLNDVLNLFYFNTPNGIGATIKDLQTKGVLEILAEPTLVTIDGQSARFLAGGEFPFPVIQPGSGSSNATVTIQFRQYGVKLEFTPFVNPDGTIRLKIIPEVSALDYTNVVVISGYTIPSLSTRHVETEIELRDGQTFGISGILDHRTSDAFNKIPGIGDVPILGQLFKSKSQNHSVMELVVVVTPTLVDPLSQPDREPQIPQWITPPGQIGTFNKGLPKSYQPTEQEAHAH